MKVVRCYGDREGRVMDLEIGPLLVTVAENGRTVVSSPIGINCSGFYIPNMSKEKFDNLWASFNHDPGDRAAP